jgi:hypothetical protein
MIHRGASLRMTPFCQIWYKPSFLLRLDELRVDSFEAGTPMGAQGTVHGEQISRFCPSAICTVRHGSG